jgi:RNA polymerase sigma-70 factor, ECF subfamily
MIKPGPIHNGDNDELRWAALMMSAQQGHEAHYHTLLTELASAIQRYLCSRFGQQNFIEDCVQESLVAIHEARHTYDPAKKFRPWLFAIVRHKAIDTLRRQSSYQNAVNAHAGEYLAVGQASHTLDVENSLSQKNLFNLLSEQHREAITLTKLNGYSIAEAAHELEISESALKVRIHRGIEKLRRLVQADNP